METLQAPMQPTLGINTSASSSNFDVNLLTNLNFVSPNDPNPNSHDFSKSFYQSKPQVQPSSNSLDSGISDNIRNDNMELDEISLDNSQFKFPQIRPSKLTTLDNFYPKMKSYTKSRNLMYGEAFGNKVNILSNITIGKNFERSSTTSLFSTDSSRGNEGNYFEFSICNSGDGDNVGAKARYQVAVVEDDCESSKSTIVDGTELAAAEKERQFTDLDRNMIENCNQSPEIISQTENFDYDISNVLAEKSGKQFEEVQNVSISKGMEGVVQKTLSDADTIEIVEIEDLEEEKTLGTGVVNCGISEGATCVEQSSSNLRDNVVHECGNDEISVTAILRNLQSSNLNFTEKVKTACIIDNKLNIELREKRSVTNVDSKTLPITYFNRKRKNIENSLNPKLPKLFEDLSLNFETLTVSCDEANIANNNLETSQDSLFSPTCDENHFNHSEIMEDAFELPTLSENIGNGKDEEKVLTVEERNEKFLYLEKRLKRLESEDNYEQNISEVIDEVFETIKEIKKELLRNADEVIKRKCNKAMEKSSLVVEKPSNPFFYNGNQPLPITNQEKNNPVVSDYLNDATLHLFDGDDEDDDAGPNDVIQWKNIKR